MPEFSERLKELRKERNLTQKQLAEDLGIATSTIIKYERGEREPNISNIKKISNYFGITTDNLLGFDSDYQSLDLSSKQQTLWMMDETNMDKGGLQFNDSYNEKLDSIIAEQRALAHMNAHRNIAIKYGICTIDQLKNLSYEELYDKIDEFRETLKGKMADKFLWDTMEELQKQQFCTWNKKPGE